jgi:hypothetical protein
MPKKRNPRTSSAKKTRKKVKRIGEARQSQALRTFGVGSIVDFRFHSVMPLGLEHWPPKYLCQTIHEPDLERLLEKRWFQAPPVADENRAVAELLKAVRFPRWLFCPECHALGMVRDISEDTDVASTEPTFGERFAFVSLNDGKPKCTRMNGKRPCNGIGVPTRLVVVCTHPKGPETDHLGHIDDFPWYDWVHFEPISEREESKAEVEEPNKEQSKAHYLSLRAQERTLAIDDLVVECSCGKRKPLSGVFSKDAMRFFRCQGWRPWLENRRDSTRCGRPLKAFLRGATNLHLPVTTAVISIPPYSDALNTMIDDFIDDIIDKWEDDCEDRAEEGLEPRAKNVFAARRLSKLREQGFDRDQEFSDEKIISCIVDRISGGSTNSSEARISQQGRRYAECLALRQGDINPRGNFDAVPVQVPERWEPYISKLVKVRKLRKVEAIQGFRRDSQGNPDALPSQSLFAPLSIRPMPWLPAIEMKGEGIFVELNLDRIRNWESREAVQLRMSEIQKSFNIKAEEEGWEEAQCPSARFILVHTFAHLLIRQLTLECGYSSAALQERLYVATAADIASCPGVGEEMAGCLIYTSTTDSDGSFGGLVRMGEPLRFTDLMRDALRIATWCSSDPVCSTVEGQGYMGLNRAACHACVLLPETSCERRNSFLDRVLVVKPRGMSDDAAFFAEETFTNF